MSAKESAGFKLLVVLVFGGVAVGALMLKRQMTNEHTPVATSTTGSPASTASVTMSAIPVASSPKPPLDAGPTSEDQAAVAEAASKGDLGKVQALADKGVALKGTLGPAAKSGNVDLVRWLVDHGVDVHENESSANAPLLEADEHEAVTAVLLGRGTKEPSLAAAIEAGAAKAVARQLASKKADPNAKTDEGAPMLFLAVKQGTAPKHLAITKALLDAGAKPDEGLNGETPLHAAIHRVELDGDSIDAVKLLLTKATVDPDSMMDALAMRSDKKDFVVDALLAGRLSPGATFRGVATTTDPKVVARLAAKGINWKTKDPHVEEAPLTNAAMRQDVELVKALLAAGAPADGNEDTSESPLLAIIAASTPGSEDALKIVNALLARGANPNRKAKDGRRPLHAAADRGHTAIVNALLAKGASVTDEFNGSTALEIAEAGGHDDVVKALIAKGAKKRTPKP